MRLEKNLRCYFYWVWTFWRNWLLLSANRGGFTLGSGFWLHLWNRVSSQSCRRTSCQTTYGTERTDSKKKDDLSDQVSRMKKSLCAFILSCFHFLWRRETENTTRCYKDPPHTPWPVARFTHYPWLLILLSLTVMEVSRKLLQNMQEFLGDKHV